jgi:hypothetical protein
LPWKSGREKLSTFLPMEVPAVSAAIASDPQQTIIPVTAVFQNRPIVTPRLFYRFELG